MCSVAYINKTNRFVFKQGHLPIKCFGNDSVHVGENNFYFNHHLTPPPSLLLDVKTCKKNQRAKGPKIAVNTIVFTCDRLVYFGGGGGCEGLHVLTFLLLRPYILPQLNLAFFSLKQTESP